MRDKEFEQKIYQYIEENEQECVNSVDIGCAILPYKNKDMEDVLNSIAYMENDVKIARIPNGIRYVYVIVK